MSKVFVLATALIFFVYGLLFFAMPLETFGFVVDGSVTSSSAVIDLRATYGGMSAAVGVILLLLASNVKTLRVAVVSVFLLMFGMAFGRSLGIYLDGGANAYMYGYLILELAACAIALLLLKVDRSQ